MRRRSLPGDIVERERRPDAARESWWDVKASGSLWLTAARGRRMIMVRLVRAAADVAPAQ